MRFIEDNRLGRERIGNGSNDALTGSLAHMFSFSRRANHQLFLNPNSGEPTGRGWGRGSRSRRR